MHFASCLLTPCMCYLIFLQILSSTLSRGRGLGKEHVLQVLRCLHTAGGSDEMRTDDEFFRLFDLYASCGCLDEGRQMMLVRGLQLLRASNSSCCQVVGSSHIQATSSPSSSSASASPTLLSRALCFLQHSQQLPDVQKLLDCAWFDLMHTVVQIAQQASFGAASEDQMEGDDRRGIRFVRSLSGKFIAPPLPPLPSSHDGRTDIYPVYKRLAGTLRDGRSGPRKRLTDPSTAITDYGRKMTFVYYAHLSYQYRCLLLPVLLLIVFLWFSMV